jgi:cell division protein FtsN
MPQDYAKKHKPATSKRTRAAGRGSRSQPASPRRWFFAGLACGVFLSALVWLASQQPELVDSVAAVGKPTAAKNSAPKPTFDFYTLLPEQQVEVDVEPRASDQGSQRTPIDQYLLQAGSFQLAEDADRRRAELILLGLEARVQETQGSNGRWFRVYVGPFESRSRLEKARSLTAQQGIDTLAGLKLCPPAA